MSDTFSTRVATGVGAILEKRFSRRSLLGRTAVVGAALAVSGLDFVLKPQDAYAAVCGPGASCAGGWTAMCCTINNGVNQCPAGSFAGGWWKADSAGLCGGSARYYIDCQAECTRCGCSGSSFCTSGCWNCTRHCASGTCDERRVCWNVFRYGQCNQQIGCSGPVLCRMISCNPPWTFEACTTDAATDNNTTDHSAPCLSPWSSVQARYQQLGGPASALGVSTGAELAVAGGTMQAFTKGRLYGSAAGVHTLFPPRTTVFDAEGGAPALGVPITDDARSATGSCAFNDLSKGAAVYTTPNGTFVVSGSIYTTWAATGRDAGRLGWPIAGSATVSGGTVQLFSKGRLYASPAGTHALFPPRTVAYDAAGGAAALGVPITDDARSATGACVFNDLSKNAAVYSTPNGTYVVSGSIYTTWAAAGRDAGQVGWPVAGVTTVPGGVAQAFSTGLICIATSVGTRQVWGAVYEAYAEAGGPTGRYGLPTGDVVVDGLTQSCTFQNGTISLRLAPRRLTRS
jgi:hypothetical protein